MIPSKDAKIYIPDRETHDRLLKDYVDNTWKDKDVEVDWEWSGPGLYRIHEHAGTRMLHVNTRTFLPCVSFKWEGV